LTLTVADSGRFITASTPSASTQSAIQPRSFTARPPARSFQRLEKIFADFPTIGKNFPFFSNDWKIFFQWLENPPRFFQ
jgi:hypothetical protein